jgi:hypothetical protein
MESNTRYYQRRAVEELRAAARAVTPEARERRRALADMFAGKAAQFQMEQLQVERLSASSQG